jgi:S1-C subfamily serine protease
MKRASLAYWASCAGIAWATLVASSSVSFSAETKAEKIYRKVLPAVMTLEVDNFDGDRFVGSGILGLADDVVITAWHVVSDARSVKAVFADGTRLQVIGCIDSDGERDLALLKLEKPLRGRKVAFARNLQPVATRTFVIGAPKGFGFSISDGLLSQIRDIDGIPQYQISCPISPGNSGGPVLNSRGEVIGIASWTKADAQNLSFAIPTQELGKLNLSGKVVPWQQLALTARPAIAPRSTGSGHGGGSNAADDVNLGFAGFTDRLERSIGRKITVIVQENGKENRFQFTVPERSLK